MRFFMGSSHPSGHIFCMGCAVPLFLFAGCISFTRCKFFLTTTLAMWYNQEGRTSPAVLADIIRLLICDIINYSTAGHFCQVFFSEGSLWVQTVNPRLGYIR